MEEKRREGKREEEKLGEEGEWKGIRKREWRKRREG